MRSYIATLLLLALTAPLGADGPDTLRTDLGPVPDFTLTERSGRTVRRDDLKGKVWVAAFIYTCCETGCSTLTDNLAILQKRLANCPDARLVCFSVHPAQDTPETLRAYASEKGADPERWLFLTGDERAIYALCEKGFYRHVKRDPTGPKGQDVVHSFHFTVVDQQGNIRGYADGRNEEALYRIEQRVRQLLEPEPVTPSVSVLPAVNAALNGTCGLLLIIGYLGVRNRWITFHKVCMLTALAVSVVFLGSYLYYHFVVRNGTPTRFTGAGWVQPLYYGVLGSHTILAALVAPLALLTTYRGLRGTIARHTRLARWTLPIWLYVSVTGVIVYIMLYQLFPAH